MSLRKDELMSWPDRSCRPSTRWSWTGLARGSTSRWSCSCRPSAGSPSPRWWTTETGSTESAAGWASRGRRSSRSPSMGCTTSSGLRGCRPRPRDTAASCRSVEDPSDASVTLKTRRHWLMFHFLFNFKLIFYFELKIVFFSWRTRFFFLLFIYFIFF